MMMSVAAHAITSYVQFRALAEVLIQRGVFTREDLEAQFALMQERELDRTIDEWFTPDIAYHIKMAVQSAMAQDEAQATATGGADDASRGTGQPDAGQGVWSPTDPDDVARARAMQSGG